MKIKRGHTNTVLPDDAIQAVFSVSVRNGERETISGYGYVMFVPNVGFIEHGGSRSNNYQKTWFDCIKDILDCVPKNSTVIVNTRYRNFVTALVGDYRLPNNTYKEKKWRESVINFCEKKGITLYMHTLYGEKDETEKKAVRLASKYMREEYKNNKE